MLNEDRGWDLSECEVVKKRYKTERKINGLSNRKILCSMRHNDLLCVVYAPNLFV